MFALAESSFSDLSRGCCWLCICWPFRDVVEDDDEVPVKIEWRAAKLLVWAGWLLKFDPSPLE